MVVRIILGELVQTGHLFEPMPEVIRDDMAFIDRLHFYLPGWEIPKMRNDLFTDHYGFVVDYLAEALRELRRHNFTEITDRHFTMGSHLVTRDRKAVKKTVSGLMKIIHPHGEATQDEIAELLEFAMVRPRPRAPPCHLEAGWRSCHRLWRRPIRRYRKCQLWSAPAVLLEIRRTSAEKQ